MKVLLINPQLTGERRYHGFIDVGSYQPPYGLLCIAAVLEEAGFDVKVLDADSRKGIPLPELLRQSVEYAPDAVGFTAYSIGVDHVLATAKAIKEGLGVPVVVGGPHVMAFPDDLTGHDFIDYLVTGEGELTAVELFTALRDGGGVGDVAGIIYRRGGEVVRTPDRELIDDLDSLPYPAFHLLADLKEYAPTQMMYKRLPILMLTTSRGCPYSCIFCNSIWGKRYRYNSAEYVMGLVQRAVKEWGFREIMFYEDQFCLRNERVLRVCELFREMRLGVPWSCSSHANHLDRELLGEMRDAGCWMISIGIESGCQRILDFTRKSTTIGELEDVTRWADEAGIKLRGFFIIGHLTETKETIRQTIDFAKSLPLFTVNFTILQLLPGSRVRDIAHEYGQVDYDLTLGTGHPGDRMSFVPKGLTRAYLLKMQKRAYAEFFLRPRQLLRLIRSIESFDDVRKYFTLGKTFVKLMVS